MLHEKKVVGVKVVKVQVSHVMKRNAGNHFYSFCKVYKFFLMLSVLVKILCIERLPINVNEFSSLVTFVV